VGWMLGLSLGVGFYGALEGFGAGNGRPDSFHQRWTGILMVAMFGTWMLVSLGLCLMDWHFLTSSVL